MTYSASVRHDGVATIIDPITKKTFLGYSVEIVHTMDSSTVRHGSQGRLQPAGTVVEKHVEIHDVVIPVLDYYSKPVITIGSPLIVKYENKTMLGRAHILNAIHDTGAETVRLDISLLEVSALTFAELIDDLIREEG